MPKEPAPVVTWPEVLLVLVVLATVAEVAGMVMGDHGGYAPGVVLGAIGYAATKTLVWLVRR